MRLYQWFIPVLIGLILMLLSACQNSRTTDSPQIFLWAWERSENLEFIDPGKVGVAFLAQTIELSGSEVQFIPRRQPLKVLPETKLIAVTRIETDKKSPNNVTFSDSQRKEILRLILKSLELKNVSGIQIDFDVTFSEREAYRQILRELRPLLPANIGLTMTALASWCTGDTWLKDLPVDESVPMTFDMGADDKTIREFLANGEDWPEPLCRQSYGVSVDQPLKINFKENRKFFLFTSNPNGWKKSDLERLDVLKVK